MTLAQLIDAAARGDTAAVLALLERGLDVNSVSADGWTPLLYATVGRHVETAAALLAAGADANARAVDGSTPLLKGALWGDAHLVRLLLRHGADPGATDADGWSPLKMASAGGHVECEALLRAWMVPRIPDHENDEPHEGEGS